MAAITTEAGLEEKTKEWLKTLPGVFYFKAVGGAYQLQGLPDLIICWAGHFVAIELKKPGRLDKLPYKPGSPTEVLQVRNIAAIKAAGGYAGIFDDLQEIKDFLLALTN